MINNKQTSLVLSKCEHMNWKSRRYPLRHEELPEGDWYCPHYTCSKCGDLVKDKDSSNSPGFKCAQCDHKYHDACIKDGKISTKANSGKMMWCGGSCHQLAVALTIMEESFSGMHDSQTGIEMLPQVMYNWGSIFPRLNYHGFNSIVLEKDDVKNTRKESLQWGLADGLYSGLTYGLYEARRVHDWYPMGQAPPTIEAFLHRWNHQVEEKDGIDYDVMTVQLPAPSPIFNRWDEDGFPLILSLKEEEVVSSPDLHRWIPVKIRQKHSPPPPRYLIQPSSSSSSSSSPYSKIK
ncbi:hypothetical protein ACFE04_002882 [Oxalis oulophora]